MSPPPAARLEPTPGATPSRPSPSPAQLERACAGDPTALEALVQALLPAVRLEVTHALHHRARRRQRDARQDIDDFVQDVMVHLLSNGGRRLQAWDPGRGRSLPSFVRLLTRHRIGRILEGFRGNPWEGGANDEPDLVEQQPAASSGAFERVLRRQQLERLLAHLHARLSERGAMIFSLLYVEQRSVREVCEAMDMSRAAVDQWNVRLRQLARRLADELDRDCPPIRAGRRKGREHQ